MDIPNERGRQMNKVSQIVRFVCDECLADVVGAITITLPEGAVADTYANDTIDETQLAGIGLSVTCAECLKD